MVRPVLIYAINTCGNKEDETEDLAVEMKILIKITGFTNTPKLGAVGFTHRARQINTSIRETAALESLRGKRKGGVPKIWAQSWFSA